MSFILNGRYHEGEPPDFAAMVPQKTSVWKASDHDRQRRDYAHHMVQPYLPNGEINDEFITVFPDESRETYKFVKSDEDIAREH